MSIILSLARTPRKRYKRGTPGGGGNRSSA